MTPPMRFEVFLDSGSTASITADEWDRGVAHNKLMTPVIAFRKNGQEIAVFNEKRVIGIARVLTGTEIPAGLQEEQIAAGLS